MEHLPSDSPGVREIGQKEGYVNVHDRRVQPFTRTVGRLNGRVQYIARVKSCKKIYWHFRSLHFGVERMYTPYMSSVASTSPIPATKRQPPPPLMNGDRLTRDEFEHADFVKRLAS
jgi:hypothetical protein